MSIHGKDFVRYSYKVYVAARKTNSPDEAECRTIVSRAYYGAFLTAREYAGIKSRNNVHQRVFYYFNRNKLKSISERLRALKKRRAIADYILDFDINIQHAKISCDQ
nr:hypothetical protein [Gammaproteobacteria bacterium]